MFQVFSNADISSRMSDKKNTVSGAMHWHRNPGGGGVDIELAPNSLTYGIEFEVCNESQWGAAEIAVDLYASSPWKTDQHKY